LPEYTVSDEVGVPAVNGRFGILFAHRFSSVKRPKQLAYMTHEPYIMRILKDKVTAHGVASGQNLMWERDRVDPIEPIWDRRKQYHNIYDFDRYSKLMLDHKYFWNVSGSSRTEYKLKRLDLTGFEAVFFGCIPWVNKDYCPDWIGECCVRVSIDEPYDWVCLESELLRVEQDYESILEELRVRILDSDYSYYGVASQVEEILKCSES
jgi:hypothetical protein